ncbi:phytoene desaturase family protein [Conexibacter sp. SYSU D00693]|uniref:phytoene desaturase family protein n=1 Tax=Conexibacter sp. SYSU D00693 TaxID=2812560 RepID=UPI00196BA2DA|nr:phytoene desaturase family protein [Conexibacter sp. SYSU D00693]
MTRRAVVIGAGLGGLAAALRLQGAGFEVCVLERGERPGGRAGQLRDAGFTWDTGPSLVTMPWVLEEAFAAGGLDLHREVDLQPLDPYYRIHWAGEERHLDFVARERMPDELARFSARDAAAFEGFMEALAPIYTDGIVAAGRRAFLSPMDLVRFLPRMLSLGAAVPLHHMVARHFRHPRVREAMSFHSLFIGGDPFRVPAIYGALVYLQFLDGVWYATGGVHAIVEAMARALDVRCDTEVERIETAGGRVTGVVTRGGERIAADVVVGNGDVLATHELLGRRPPLRRLRPTMSCFLLYLGTDRPFEQLHHHTLLVGEGYKDFIADVTRRGRLPRTSSTYLHVPTRTEPAMGDGRGDSICVLLPVPNLRGGQDWAVEADRVRDWLVRDLETTFGLEGLGAATVVEHRMTPQDFRTRFGAVDGNAFATEPTLHQSAWFRQHNRDPKVAGLYHVGGGVHPGAGIPGVVLGAEVTAGLVLEDHPHLPATRGRAADAAAVV